MKKAESEMITSLSTLPPSSLTGKDHEEALKKTKHNLDKKKEELSRRATRKMETLRKPQANNTGTHEGFREGGPWTIWHHNTAASANT